MEVQDQEAHSHEQLQSELQTIQNEHNDLAREWRFATYHPTNQITGNPDDRVRTCSFLNNLVNNIAFLSQIEHKNIEEALEDDSLLIAMNK